jgi:biotin operon repressor
VWQGLRGIFQNELWLHTHKINVLSERTKMEHENKRAENVKKLEEFLAGKRLSLEIIISREDKEDRKSTLFHFVDKDTGIELFSEWRKADKLFGGEKKETENIGGREPYAMLFTRRVKKVFSGEYVGSKDSQLSALVLLSEYIQMNTGKLVKKKSKKPLTQQDIAKELGLSVRRTATILADLKANGVIERQDGAYLIKREFLARGRMKHGD